MGYRVVIEDGPAGGWSYFTATAPDEVIALAPGPSSMRGERWMRVSKVAGPWPGQRLYCRGPLPARDADELTVPDEVPISYRLVRSCGAPVGHRSRAALFRLADRTPSASFEPEQQAGVVG